MFRSVPALFAASMCAGPAAAESLVALRDPAYGLTETAAQAAPVPSRVRQIVYPTLGMPALVRPAERFSVLLRADCAPDLALLEASAALVRVPDAAVALTVLGVLPGPEGSWWIHLRTPADLAADSYHLSLQDGACVQDRQPSALRGYRLDGAHRVAVLADEQLGDPTGLLPGGEPNGALYPTRGLVDLAVRRRRQVRQELEFLDPLLVLYPGDLCFGMDYPTEYAAVVDRFAQARLAVFAVPGNHDAYAAHSVTTRPGWHRQVHRAAFCVGSFTPGSPLDGVGAVGGCVLSRLSEVLDYRLETDGLEAWQRSLGPASYAFSVAGVRFVGLNTYGGSQARRTAVPFSMGRLRDWVELDLLAEAGLDPLLGAPLVDNFGGYLEARDLAWVDAQVRDARQAGEALVLFGHHDPTGAYLGEQAVRANDSFGTDPVGLGGFEVWNFDGGWDSDPDDAIGVETAVAHSGARLLRSLGGGPATVVVGHAHYDSERHLGAARSPEPQGGLRVLQATTAGAGLAHEGAHRGYLLAELGAAGLGPLEGAPELGWSSLPLGNFWTEERARPDGPPDRVLVTGLPLPLRGRLRFELPAAAQGYRFWLSDGQQEQPVLASELMHAGGTTVAWVEIEAPATPRVAQEQAELSRRAVRWELAEGNAAPQARIALAGRAPPRGAAPLRVRAGRELSLSAAGSSDEGPLHAASWTVGGMEIEGLEARLRIDRPGRYPVQLRVMDAQGAVGEAEAELRVRPRLWPAWTRARGRGAR